MTTELTAPVEIKLNANEVFCIEGEEDKGMFKIETGRLMVCLTKKSQVTPVAYLEAGEFFGEFSFFDNLPRSATVITLEPTILRKFSIDTITDNMPAWMLILAKSMARKIREGDVLIKNKGIKKANVDNEITPLSIEDQSHFYKLINQRIDS